MSNVAPLELAWVAIAGVGLGFSLANLRGTWAALKRWRSAGRDGFGLIYISGNLRQEILRTIAFVSALGVGILAATIPPAPPVVQAAPRSGLIAGLLFVFLVLLDIKSIDLWLTRRKLRQIERRSPLGKGDA